MVAWGNKKVWHTCVTWPFIPSHNYHSQHQQAHLVKYYFSSLSTHSIQSDCLPHEDVGFLITNRLKIKHVTCFQLQATSAVAFLQRTTAALFLGGVDQVTSLSSQSCLETWSWKWPSGGHCKISSGCLWYVVCIVICSVEREKEIQVQKEKKQLQATEEEDDHYKSWGKKERNYDVLVNALPLCHRKMHWCLSNFLYLMTFHSPTNTLIITLCTSFYVLCSWEETWPFYPADTWTLPPQAWHARPRRRQILCCWWMAPGVSDVSTLRPFVLLLRVWWKCLILAQTRSKWVGTTQLHNDA